MVEKTYPKELQYSNSNTVDTQNNFRKEWRFIPLVPMSRLWI